MKRIELREEVGVKESFRKKLVKCQLKWAGHVERMEGERLMKRADALRVEGRRKGRPQLSWEDCVKKDLVGAGGDQWRRRRKTNIDQFHSGLQE